MHGGGGGGGGNGTGLAKLPLGADSVLYSPFSLHFVCMCVRACVRACDSVCAYLFTRLTIRALILPPLSAVALLTQASGSMEKPNQRN